MESWQEAKEKEETDRQINQRDFCMTYHISGGLDVIGLYVFRGVLLLIPLLRLAAIRAGGVSVFGG